MKGTIEVHSPDPRAGFTLVEVMVALVVFSVAVLALLSASGENARALTALGETTLANVVAENRMVEAMVMMPAPPVGIASGEDQAGDRSWTWRRTIADTDVPGFRRLEIAVQAAGEDRVLAVRTAFRGEQ